MRFFEELNKEEIFLLNELHQSRQSDVVKAVNNMLRVSIGYDDGKGGKGKNRRYILPVAFGVDKNGKKIISAYQTSGSSKRGVPEWKLFFYDKIYSWDNSKRNFKEYSKQLIDLGLNTDVSGDKRMTKIFAITPIANPNVMIDKETIPITSEPLLKPDVTQKWIDKLAASKSSQKYLSANKSKESSIDNTKDQSYLKNKMEAPPTQPTTKVDVQGGTGSEQEPQQLSNQAPKIMATTTGPIMQQDINQEPENDNNTPEKKSDVKDNDITNTFNDMTNRMDNLYKNEED